VDLTLNSEETAPVLVPRSKAFCRASTVRECAYLQGMQGADRKVLSEGRRRKR
jgi:hypothetical protein